MRFAPFILALNAPVGLAHAPSHGFCVENQSARAAVFVVDAGADYRGALVLAKGERLCTPEFPEPIYGFVSVFYDLNAIEGCSRLTSAGSVQVLLKYHDFDNCEWRVLPGQ